MTVFLADSNVLLDIATGNPVWADWSHRQLDDAWQEGQVVVNQIIYAEMSLNFSGVIPTLEKPDSSSVLPVMADAGPPSTTSQRSEGKSRGCRPSSA